MRNYLRILTKGMLIILAGLYLGGCQGIRQDIFSRKTPHEKYVEKLQQAGLDQNLLGQKWISAAYDVLEQPVQAALPFSEVVVFNVSNYLAASYLLDLNEGQNLHVVVEAEQADTSAVFIDIFKSGNGGLDHEDHAPLDSLNLAYSIKRTGGYVVRIQPELLTQGLYRIYFYTGSSLSFPVEDKDFRNISSFYGDPRDGGNRRHEGVDVFAPRGAAAVAVASGRVSRTGTNRLGGNVVWLRDQDRGYSYYYAHLDSQLIEPGAHVSAGDTLGLIGNTGNALTTPPHLHFGIYTFGRGSVDPFHFFHSTARENIEIKQYENFIDNWGRITGAKANVRTAPGIENPIHQTVNQNEPVYVKGVTNEWFHIELTDGSTGYVHESLLEIWKNNGEKLVTNQRQIVREKPNQNGLATGILLPGTEVDIYGEFNSFQLIGTNDMKGWISRDL